MPIGCEFTYVSEIAASTVFQVEPLPDQPGFTVSDARWGFEPDAAVRRYTDLYGNPCLRTVLPEGVSSLHFDAVATVPDAVEDADESAPEVPADALPDDVLIYTLPSRFALPDMLGDEAWTRFAHLPPDYTRVQAICDHVHEHLTFQYGTASRPPPRSTSSPAATASAATSPTWPSRSAEP